MGDEHHVVAIEQPGVDRRLGLEDVQGRRSQGSLAEGLRQGGRYHA